MDAIGFAHPLKNSEDADNVNWITEIEEMRFHLRPGLHRHLGNIT